jgi:PAS domain S-box-containing protein
MSPPGSEDRTEHTDRFAASLTDEGRYRLLIDAVTDYAIYMLSPEGIVTSWNPGARRFKGYEASEIIGEHFSQFYVEEDRAAGLPQLALETAARDGKFENEGWRTRKDGTRFWAHVVIDPIRTETGVLVGYAKITRDLTERKQAEEIVIRSQEQFRLLVQGVTDYSLYMLDPQGIVTNWNVGAERIKGYRADEIVGLHFSRFYTQEDLDSGLPRKALDTAAREGRFENEGRRVRKDGTTFWANVVIDAIRDEDGKLIGFAKITRDITERRAAQQALETAREALFQSQKMDAIGQLTGGVAHDFNNLLMAVLGSLDLVKKRLPEDPKVTPLLDNAVKAAKRGAALTQRMLAFARRQELKPEPVDAVSLVRGMAELLERSLGPSIVIETRFPISLDRVHADANQLEMALLNLAVNARDAMPDGGTIVIAAREQTVGKEHTSGLAPGRYICLSVQDHGEGMDTATLARAAEPFFTTKGIGKGTGLGLSMVHGLAEQSGGRLLLNSQKGKGTTAEIWLPVMRSSRDADAGQPDMAAAPVESPRAGRLTIVAVDDDSLVLMNTVAMLEDLGHQVLEAASGKEALEIFQQHESIDLLVVDQAMPRMTGTQLIEKIREARPDLPIILATGYAELPADAPENLLRLSKPFSQTELAKMVSDAIAQELSKPEPSTAKVLKFRQP